jgi:hypothetical protein
LYAEVLATFLVERALVKASPKPAPLP